MYWLKVEFMAKGVMDGGKKWERGKQIFRNIYIKREKFGYLLEIARGVWVFRAANEKGMRLQFQTSSKHTQLFRFSWSWQGRLGG